MRRRDDVFHRCSGLLGFVFVWVVFGTKIHVAGRGGPAESDWPLECRLLCGVGWQDPPSSGRTSQPPIRWCRRALVPHAEQHKAVPSVEEGRTPKGLWELQTWSGQGPKTHRHATVLPFPPPAPFFLAAQSRLATAQTCHATRQPPVQTCHCSSCRNLGRPAAGQLRASCGPAGLSGALAVE